MSRSKKKIGEPSGSGAYYSGNSRSNNTTAFDGNKAAILVSLCAIIIGGIAALLYKLRQKKDKDKQKEQTRGR